MRYVKCHSQKQIQNVNVYIFMHIYGTSLNPRYVKNILNSECYMCILHVRSCVYVHAYMLTFFTKVEK